MLLAHKKKQPLNMLFLCMESNTNNKNIYKIEFLQYCKVLIEPVRSVRQIPLCGRCWDEVKWVYKCNKIVEKWKSSSQCEVKEREGIRCASYSGHVKEEITTKMCSYSKIEVRNSIPNLSKKTFEELSYASAFRNCKTNSDKHKASTTEFISEDRISRLKKQVDQVAQCTLHDEDCV